MRTGLAVLFPNGQAWSWSGDVPVGNPPGWDPLAEEWIDAMFDQWIQSVKAVHPGAKVFSWTEHHPEWRAW
jgi:hypothetical protein